MGLGGGARGERSGKKVVPRGVCPARSDAPGIGAGVYLKPEAQAGLQSDRKETALALGDFQKVLRVSDSPRENGLSLPSRGSVYKSLPEKSSRPKQTAWKVRRTFTQRQTGPSGQRFWCLSHLANAS